MANIALKARKIASFLRLTRTDALTERVQRTLVRTLYTQPTSLAVGAINGIVSTAITAAISGSQILFYACILLSIVAVARVVAAFGLAPDDDGPSTSQLEIVYEVGAFSYAFLLGAIASMTLLFGLSAQLEVLMVANATCYGVGICARNAGRAAIALGQLSLVFLPIFCVALYIGTLPYLALAATIALLIPAMASITLNVFKVLRDSIRSAETSAELAEKMRKLARTDVVTGLSNRAGLNHDLVERLM